MEAHYEHIVKGIDELKQGQGLLERLISDIQPKVVTSSDHIVTLETRQGECMADCRKRIGSLENWRSYLEGKGSIIGVAVIAIVSLITSIITSIINRNLDFLK